MSPLAKWAGNAKLLRNPSIPNGKAALDLAVSDLVKSGHATPHDVVVTDKLAYILTGGDTDILDKVSEDKL